MSRSKVVIMRDWFDQIEKRCTEEQLKEISYKLIKYGIYEEYEESEDTLVNVMLDMYLPQVDAMQEAYEEKVAKSQRGGRPSGLNNKLIWELAREGLSGTDIAAKLDIPKTTIYSSIGWKNRKIADWKYYEN